MRRWLIVLLLSIGMLPAWGASSFVTGIGSSVSWYQAHVEEDSLPLRSSAQAGGVLLAGMRWGRMTCAGLLPLSYVSRSPEFGGKRMKALGTIGLGLGLAVRCGSRWGAFLATSASYARFLPPDGGAGLAWTFCGGPELWLTPPGRAAQWALVLPVGLDLRDGVGALSVGFGCRLQYAWEAEP